MKQFSSFCSTGLLALLLLALRLPAAAQAPAWQSARAVAVATAAATNNDSEVTATAVDAAGNVYLAGYFKNTVVLGGTTLTSLGIFGSADIFIAKFNPISNQFVWVRQAGGTEFDQVYALVVSGTSVYIAGFFQSSTASFGSVTLTNVRSSYSDVFVAKLTDAGSFVWAQRAGGMGDDEAFVLAVNGTSVYVAGRFDSPTANFGPATLTNAGTAATKDVFVAKLTAVGSMGSFAWAQRTGGTGDDAAYALAVSGTSVYVAGSFTSPTIGFGAVTLTNAGATTGTDDVFVAKFNDSGNFAWAQQGGGMGGEGVATIAVSGANVYVAGNFGGPTTVFGTTTLANSGLGTTEVFVAKLVDVGNTGNFTWAQQAGGPDFDYVYALAVSGANVYVVGFIGNPTAVFGTTTLSNPGPGRLYSIHLGFLASLTDPTLTPTTPSRALPPAQLYPNPARYAATLRLPAGTAPAPLTLTDALGRTVRRYPAPAGAEVTLDLRGLPAGLYLLRGAGPAQRLQVE